MFKQKFWYAEVLTVLAILNLPALAINYFEPENWYVWYALAVVAFATMVFSLRKIRRIEMFKSPAWSWEILVILITFVFVHRLLLGIAGGTHQGYFVSTLLQIPSAGIPFLVAWLLHRVPEERRVS
ncbi:hypothetical protein NTE_01625 [Candidatus Nitrososphaera evergladensis SR1]|uniref:Uncharacterized protein n=1 Tax=Candidatus Nitrososphaera evergladensis SR1 TaxID=1459636 RepID=A0A075MSA5_9ARCH|nr:hypothetical protein NTE_01625 [Candidatus Nitrososphaera evergladensis SR1]